MDASREWMYQRLDAEGFINPAFASGVEDFIRFAISQPSCMQDHMILCPCRKCKNSRFDIPDTVHYHILKDGFVRNYHEWWRHGEAYVYRLPPPSTYAYRPLTQVPVEPSTVEVNEESRDENTNDFAEMVRDLGSNVLMDDNVEDQPNPNAKKFFDMLKDCEAELYPGCEWSKLEVVAQMLNIKAEHHSSDRCYDAIATMVKNILPSDNGAIERLRDEADAAQREIDVEREFLANLPPPSHGRQYGYGSQPPPSSAGSSSSGSQHEMSWEERYARSEQRVAALEENQRSILAEIRLLRSELRRVTRGSDGSGSDSPRGPHHD